MGECAWRAGLSWGSIRPIGLIQRQTNRRIDMLKSSALLVILTGLVALPASAQQVYVPGNGVSLPVVLKEVHPTAATAATVAMNCIVAPDGTVRTVTIASSPDSKLNQAAVRALRQWQFKPGMKDGKPVPVRISVELSFTQG